MTLQEDATRPSQQQQQQNDQPLYSQQQQNDQSLYSQPQQSGQSLQPQNQQRDQSLQPQQRVLSGNRAAMEPLYEQLLQQTFSDSHSAVDFCRHACAQFGFTVKQEASANKNIYVYCSREGLPDSQRKPKLAPQRKRPSKRCDCRWRVVLSENANGLWEFRKSSNTTAYEHNHDMMDPQEMIKTWPAQVNQRIIQLARQRLQTHEIRDLIKQQFPNISWNERRFYNRLAEERKRIKQRDVVQRTQRLLYLSTHICSLVAANEDWFEDVEATMARLLDHYCYMSRMTSSHNKDGLVDLSLDHITMDLDSHYHSMRLRIADNISLASPSVVSDTSSTSVGHMDVDESLGGKKHSLFERPPPMGGIVTEQYTKIANQQQQQDILDLASHQQPKKGLDSADNMSPHRIFFMYPPGSSAASGNPSTPSVPYHPHYHNTKESLFDTQQSQQHSPLFATESYQVPKQQEHQGNSPAGVLLDN
ncbi:hypothetical protein BC941DRAFT_456524 [Chlamydoabsidia padenii]|nr:hypothetical protein BC941DRAFT_456524 [Chlamydoabsidia padenii]